MRVLIQRVKEARVDVAGKTIGAINVGLLLFLGIHKSDDSVKIPWLVNKIATLRCFADAEDKMNCCILDVNGSALVISQFTLYGDCTNGRRPDFLNAANGAFAEELYNQFVTELQKKIGHVATGEFAADMQVCLINDGPVTFLIER